MDEEKINLEVSRDELKVLTGIMMLYRLHGFNSIAKDLRETGIKLAEKLSLLEIRQWSKK